MRWLRPWPAVIAAIGLTAMAGAFDWTNLGGNPARNGLSGEIGPVAADLLWSNTDDFSIISWAPFILEGRVFTIRESGFPQNGGAANDELIAYDLEDGSPLWSLTLPWGGDTSEEWIAWILGVRDGRVYASRGGNGTTAPIHAFDAATGEPLWTSTVQIGAFAYEGVVFAPDGDLLVAWFTDLYRLEAESGDVAWHATRNCSVSGSCGPAATASAVFIDEVAPGGQVVTKFDLETGQRLYSSPVAPGFLTQKSPFLAPDGATVYFPRTQNNDLVDFLYAFTDTGSALQTKWTFPVHWTTEGYGVGPDGSVYAIDNDVNLVRLDPESGEVLVQGGALEPISAVGAVRMSVGADGAVYINNGWANDPPGNGRLYAFGADLAPRFTINTNRPNQGGPALGAGGTLVVCDRTAVRAYRTPRPPCPADVNTDGSVDVADLVTVILAWGEAGGPADVNGDGTVDVGDLVAVILAWGLCA